MSFVRFDTIGLPIINNESMIRSSGGGYTNDSHLIINILINISIFLTCLLWFTLAFNIATRGWIETDYNFVLFAFGFTLFSIVFVYILLHIKIIINN